METISHVFDNSNSKFVFPFKKGSRLSRERDTSKRATAHIEIKCPDGFRLIAGGITSIVATYATYDKSVLNVRYKQAYTDWVKAGNTEDSTEATSIGYNSGFTDVSNLDTFKADVWVKHKWLKAFEDDGVEEPPRLLEVVVSAWATCEVI